MFKSYDEEKIKDLYKELKHKGNIEDRLWANCCGNSVVRMVEAYDNYYTVRGQEALDKIREILTDDRNKMFTGGSSDILAEKLLSGKYDSKLVLTTNVEFTNNRIVRQVINKGTLPTLMVHVSEEFERQAPFDHTKRLDWLFENFDDMFFIIDNEHNS